MCGIAGVVVREGPTPHAEVDRMLGYLEHRGPDARGVHSGARGAVGQTRLAVIDLVTGDPPLTSEDETLGAVLNGEIYNFAALRTELLESGHRLKSQGDTEVIAHLAEEHSAPEVARRLDGMFAFATWDTRHERLILGRDRLGKKPLYYWSGPHCFVFGSELKAVLAHPEVPHRLAANAIPAYLALGYVPTPGTFYDGVRSLPPGHVLTLEPGEDPVVQPYWRPPITGVDGVEALDISYGEATDEVRRLITESIRRRLVADVPVGAFLSGGIDSSALVAILSGLTDRRVATFTIGFEHDSHFDERPYARQVASRFGTDHVEFVVRPDATELLEKLLWHHDQPFADSSSLPTYLLSELTRKQVTVALSGDGGDEIFAGYERFPAALARRHLERLPRSVHAGLASVAGLLPASAFRNRADGLQRLLSRPDLEMLRVYVDWVGFVPEVWRARLMPGGDRSWWDGYVQVWNGSEGAAPLHRLLDLNLRTYLLDDLLPKIDRMSMAHALEVRSPFLDVELLEFTARLPPEMKLRRMTGKRILRSAMAGILPERILRRSKHGFGVPLGQWLQRDLTPWVDSTLCNSSARIRQHLDGDALDAYVADHRRTARHGHGLWALIALETFLQREGW